MLRKNEAGAPRLLSRTSEFDAACLLHRPDNGGWAHQHRCLRRADVTGFHRSQQQRRHRSLVRRLQDDEAIVVAERVVECLASAAKFLRQLLHRLGAVLGMFGECGPGFGRVCELNHIERHHRPPVRQGTTARMAVGAQRCACFYGGVNISAPAAFRPTIIFIFVDCCTGNSSDLCAFRMRPAKYKPAKPHASSRSAQPSLRNIFGAKPLHAMKLPRRRFLHVAAGAAALPAVSRIAQAEVYPTRPVHILVGFPPGQAADISARLLGQWLSERLGQSFVIDNRPGAASTIATEQVVHAPPDGYTLLYIVASNYINATLKAYLPYNFILDI